MTFHFSNFRYVFFPSPCAYIVDFQILNLKRFARKKPNYLNRNTPTEIFFDTGEFQKTLTLYFRVTGR
jgi:hypothetical protein